MGPRLRTTDRRGTEIPTQVPEHSQWLPSQYPAGCSLFQMATTPDHLYGGHLTAEVLGKERVAAMPIMPPLNCHNEGNVGKYKQDERRSYHKRPDTRDGKNLWKGNDVPAMFGNLAASV
ncbi:hypothetical protein WJX72_011674 [[Myrmecia] bisecta]|uniref:Uncharacterized protein n=1 Tax=[Myrmecia] bisecta TaxID=41462 RepID=A0AAW1Q227_9CHLO